MLAAEQLHHGLVAGSGDFAGYEREIRRSRVGRDLWKSRNMRQPFDAGMVAGALAASAMTLTGGRFPGGHWRSRPDAATPLLRSGRAQRYPRPDGRYFFDKASSVFAAGHASRADAPDHLRVQRRVPREVAEAWSWMCPAGVYEVAAGAPEHGLVDLVVQPANCIQCGAIHAKGGRLTPPEGGSGPAYRLG
jgi:electron-transferring-flavoprotein dehydrogenase